jgi:ferrous-iron efflux pump FieF
VTALARTPAAIADTAALTRRVTLLSVGCSLFLIIIKAMAWRASGSVALLASLADSILDLVASLATFFAVRYAATPPDAEHRYGHGKAEAFAGLFQAGLVFASSVFVGWEAIRRLARPEPVEAGALAVTVMIVSMLATGGLVWAQARVLRRTASVAVSGDRAHYTADLLSNLASLVGVAGAAFLGVIWLDAAAGLLVGLWLAWGAVQVLRDAGGQLLDRDLGPEAREEIRRRVLADPVIRDVHEIRTRASGPFVHIQMHASLDPQTTLEAAHKVMVAAERRLLEIYPAADIIIHADPQGRAEPHGGAFGEH